MLGRDREWEEILSVLRYAIDGAGRCGPGYLALREPAA